jgi:hypothetical protein
MDGLTREEERTAQPAMRDTRIGDESFMRQLDHLRALIDFLRRDNVRTRPEDVEAFNLGPLWTYRYAASGRMPDERDWFEVDRRLHLLTPYFEGEVGRRFRVQQVAHLIGRMPLVFMVIAVISLLAPMLAPLFAGWLRDSLEVPGPIDFLVGLPMLVCYVTWTLSLGALGASASLAVNSLAITSDATFDIGDRRLLQIRLVVGALFGFILSLPVSLEPFGRFLNFALSRILTGGEPLAVGQVALLLLPFLLGFSTSLVLTVLSRLVAAVETFFGVRPPAQAPPGTSR